MSLGNRIARDPFTGEPLDFLIGATSQFPSCGCIVEGAGTIPDPVRIKALVANGAKRTLDAARAMRDALDKAGGR